MAQRFNRAMEIMGWRAPADTDESYEDDFEVNETDIREFTLQSYPGGQVEVEPKPVRATTVRRIMTVHPETYADARQIGETFREGIPIIMNLSELPDAEARRIVDFAAGLVFGLNGVIERVTPRVFLLSPANVEVSSDGNSDTHNLFR